MSSVIDSGLVVAEGRPLLTKRVVAQRLQVVPRTLERMVAAKTFPRPLMIAGAVRWEPEVVERFLEQARAAADARVTP